MADINRMLSEFRLAWRTSRGRKHPSHAALSERASVLGCAATHLGAGGFQDAVGAFRTRALYRPGPQSFFDEAYVRQKLGKLSLQAGDLLRDKVRSKASFGGEERRRSLTCNPRQDRKFSLQ